jgi:serine/threonine protein kinase
VDQSIGSKYVLHEALGRGAMGQVFAGTVRESGDPVAVKVLKPELVSDPDAVARFVQERQILTSIKNPNVVRVIDLVAEGETLAIVMELIHGHDLRRYLRHQSTLPPAEAVRLHMQLLYGMAAVHAAGVIHRDIKPENLLLDSSAGRPTLKLTDFGVARLSYGASLTKLSSLIGTPEYMAPELAENDSATPAADLYSAGIVLYEMLSGRTPFAGGHPLAILRRHVDQAPPPIPGVPAGLWDQITRLLAKDPAARPASAADAAAALDSHLPALASLPALPQMAAPDAGQPAGARPDTAVRPDPPTGDGTMQRHRDRGGPAATSGSPTTGDSAEKGDSRPAAPGESGLLPVPPGSPESLPNGTVLRRRDRGETPGPENALPAARPGTAAGRFRLRSRPAVVALAAAVVVILALAAILVPPRLRHPAAVSTTHTVTAASYAFTPQQYPDGLRIVRHWTLGGAKGSMLTETITASSNGKALGAQFQEAIPSSIASSLQTVQFSPAPTKIVRADPVVEWQLQVPAQGSITVGYRATVPADGATHDRLVRWAQDLQALQAQLPAPQRSKTAGPTQPSGTSTAQVPGTAPTSMAPAVSQTPESAQPAAGAQTYASDSLSTNSSSITAQVYFGQLRSVISALSGQVTFNTAASLLATNPGRCVGTVVFSQVSEPTGAVYAEGLGSGWTAAENAPSPATQGGHLHQQLVVPPSSASAGDAWQGSAQLISGNLKVLSGTYSLQLQAQNGSAQTWLVDGQIVTCSS